MTRRYEEGRGGVARAGGIVATVTAPRRRATYTDLLEVPEHLVAEILDGELVTSPRPASLHARAASAIGAALFDPFDRPPGGGDAPGGWRILYEPELHFGDDVVVPDLAGWRRERMPTFPKEHVGERFFARETLRAWAGVVLYAVAGAIGYLVTPTVALAIFVALPVFYGVTTHGLDGLRLRRRRQ